MNLLRKRVVEEIDAEVSKYDLNRALPYLITHTDALINNYERKLVSYKNAAGHPVDYDPAEKLGEQEVELIRLHKNYRYLIEKFVQLQPEGSTDLRPSQFQYLVGMIDWLLTLYQASDSLHYGLIPAGVEISDEYLINVTYANDEVLNAQEEIFATEQAGIELGLIGNPEDRVASPWATEVFLPEFDESPISHVAKL